jgi:hypothetical protein
MGQANNSNRNASLDEHKERAAGRMDETNNGPYNGNTDDFDSAKPGQGTAGGAFGEDKNAKAQADGGSAGSAQKH